MADTNSQQEFIVQGEPVKSGELADHLKRDPGVKRIAQVAPDVVILSMTKTQADRLKSAFATLVVEPNSALKQFDAD
jgi:ABC-type Fe3+-hydroxamate transport system substrate-binding protein